nr:EOG090X07H9 [Triops cancriformis]
MEATDQKKKKKRIVKHKKKAWRTTSDVRDVEKFLEEERLEQRLGAPFAERTDESLFVIDDKLEQTEEPKSRAPAVSARKRRREAIKLKCFSALESTSAVPDPLKKRNRVRLPEERRDPFVVEKKRELRAAGKIPQKDAAYLEQSAKNKAFYENKKPNERLRNDFDFDLWGEKGEEVFVTDKDVEKANLEPEMKKYILEQTKKWPLPLPAEARKTKTAIKAVEVPHPGMSYNPTFEDHQQLLQKAHDVEAQRLVNEQKLSRKLGPMLKRMRSSDREELIMSEMIQGLNEDTDEDDVNENLVELDGSGNKNERKTRQQRRKEKLMKAEEQLRGKAKDEKERMNDIYRLKTIKKEIREWEKRQQEKLVKKNEKEAEKDLKPRTLGKVKYEEPEIDLQLSEELCGSLRELKPEGDLLMDRYKSLQKRNFIEPRLRQRMKRKYKLKKFEKRSHKDPEVRKQYPSK